MDEKSASTHLRIEAALRKQAQDERDHDLGLIEECLLLTADERLQRLTAWVDLVTSARTVGPAPQ